MRETPVGESSAGSEQNMKKLMLVIAGLVVLSVLAGAAYLQHPKFGDSPKGSALKKISRSDNYQRGQFQNQIETPLFREGESFLSVITGNLRSPGQNLRPQNPVPSETPDFSALDKSQDLVVWLGHSSYFVQLHGLRILIDPVFSGNAAPLPSVNKAFRGSTAFTAEAMPPIDYLLITHDHWDHLDYPSIQALQSKVQRVVTGLGMGAHFRAWGFSEEQIVEGDWYDSVALSGTVALHIAPARHYSGRALSRNQTLWVGLVLTTADQRLYFSGDTGYGPHFVELADRFGDFDFVALDLGQYDARWPYIHMTPDQAVVAAEELGAGYLLPAHVGRFSLARHDWRAPFERVRELSESKSFELLTPVIGQVMGLSKPDSKTGSAWWEQVDDAQG